MAGVYACCIMTASKITRMKSLSPSHSLFFSLCVCVCVYSHSNTHTHTLQLTTRHTDSLHLVWYQFELIICIRTNIFSNKPASCLEMCSNKCKIQIRCSSRLSVGYVQFISLTQVICIYTSELVRKPKEILRGRLRTSYLYL